MYDDIRELFLWDGLNRFIAETMKDLDLSLIELKRSVNRKLNELFSIG